MIRTLFISPADSRASGLAAVLAGYKDIKLVQAESGAAGLVAAKDCVPHLVIADEELGDMSGLEFAEKLLRVNAMMNCALVSSLSHEDFHEQSEGMGVLAQLQADGDKKQIDALFAQVNVIAGLMGGTGD